MAVTNIKQLLQDKSFRISFLITIIFLSTGFLFLHLGWSEYGTVLFVVLPLLVGTATEQVPVRTMGRWGLWLGLFFFLGFLLVSMLEGMICILMALPIVLPLIFFGRMIARVFYKNKEDPNDSNLVVMMWPLLIFLFGAPLEKSLTPDEPVVVAISSEIILPYTANEVYDAIKSVDTLDAEKPLLLKIDLPVPQKCILEKEEVGALRTCYFEGGKIVERITELERGKVLRMDVIDYELTGRNWLAFEEAIYYFENLDNGHSKMTRITTYSSELRPRIYWAPLERIGIEQEHEYVFNNLKKDLKQLR